MSASRRILSEPLILLVGKFRLGVAKINKVELVASWFASA